MHAVAVLVLWLCAVQLAAVQSHRVTMYSRMQQLRQQLHMDVHRNHRRLQQLLQEQQELQQQGQAVNMDAQICPVKRQMEVVLGGVDDTVGVVPCRVSINSKTAWQICTQCWTCSHCSAAASSGMQGFAGCHNHSAAAPIPVLQVCAIVSLGQRWQ